MQKLTAFLLILLLCHGTARADTVYGLMTTAISGGGSQFANVTTAATRYTNWIRVSNMRSVTFEIDYIHGALGTTTAVTLTCQTYQGNSQPVGTGRELHMIVATSAAGVNTTVPFAYTTAVATGAGYTRRWTWTVTNLPSDYLQCAFAFDSGSASDFITVVARGLTP